MCTEYFEDVRNGHEGNVVNVIKMYYRNVQRSGTTINVDISVADMKNVVKDLKNGKAQGVDQVTTSMVKYRVEDSKFWFG